MLKRVIVKILKPDVFNILISMSAERQILFRAFFLSFVSLVTPAGARPEDLTQIWPAQWIKAVEALIGISVSIPHPQGKIRVKLISLNGRNPKATINLPVFITGIFRWKGREYKLKSGLQTIKL